MATCLNIDYILQNMKIYANKACQNRYNKI